MRKGWSREDIDEIIARFDTKLPNMHLRLIRSELVAHMFGDTAQAYEARKNDHLIQQAMSTKQELIEEVNEQLRFIYPVSSIGLPIEFAFNTLTGLFALTVLIVLVITLLSIRSLIVNPIINLSQYMRHLRDDNEHENPEKV